MNEKIFIIILFVLVIIVSFQFTVIERENKLLKTVMIADKDWGEIAIPKQRAESYYDLAGYAYEDGNYQGTESNCILSRDNYMEVISGYGKIKSGMVRKNFNYVLINLYVDLLNEQIEMSYNLYEACEHFEAAARSYDNYNYDMGDSEIEMMNDKIVAHDSGVKRYNDLMSEYSFELKKLE